MNKTLLLITISLAFTGISSTSYAHHGESMEHAQVLLTLVIFFTVFSFLFLFINTYIKRIKCKAKKYKDRN